MINSFSAYEEDFAAWRRDGYPGVRPETYSYIDFLSSPEDDSRRFPTTEGFACAS